MKVKLEKEYKSRYTLEELDQAKAVIQYEKEYDSETVNEWASMAAREALKGTGDYLDEILKAGATTAKNGRAWKLYGEETGQMDVWIEATARTLEGFLIVGAYLSDIWQTGGTDYREHMYLKRFTEAR